MKIMNIQTRSERVELAPRHLFAGVSCEQRNTENKTREMPHQLQKVGALTVARSVVQQ